MGGKQSKIEANHIPESPVTQCKTLQIDNAIGNSLTDLDPRSPAVCRTPIIFPTKSNTSVVQLSCVDVPKSDHHSEKRLDVLRKRFLKSFAYNLSDPRSPSVNLNRTPLVFEDSHEKPLSLDDTFSNLFVEPDLPKVLNKIEQPEEVPEKEEFGTGESDEVEKQNMDLEEIATEQKTCTVLQQEFDPRSPSIGVERTPIIFTDDEVDDTSEDVMLESILATLSLDMNSSGDVSIMSTKSQNENNFTNKINSHVVPLNKHLDRVRTGKNVFMKARHHKTTRRASHRKIYEDQENYFPLTPIFKGRQPDKSYIKGKRTPLSCVRNRNDTHTRSRSVESSVKSIKTRLALTSFDDTLNPAEKNNLRVIRQGSQEPLDLN